MMKTSHYITGSLAFLTILGTAYTLSRFTPQSSPNPPEQLKLAKALPAKNLSFPRFTTSQAR